MSYTANVPRPWFLFGDGGRYATPGGSLDCISSSKQSRTRAHAVTPHLNPSPAALVYPVGIVRVIGDAIAVSNSKLEAHLFLTGPDGKTSHWRDCHFTDIPSKSMLKHLLKGEGGAA